LRNMKLLMIFPWLSENLVMKDVVEIPLFFSKMGHHVEYITYQSEGNRNLVEIDGIEIEKVRMPKVLKPLNRLSIANYFGMIPTILTKRRDYDCVLIYFMLPDSLILCALLKLLRPKAICVIKMDTDRKIFSQGTSTVQRVKRYTIEAMYRYLSRYVGVFIVETPEAMSKIVMDIPWIKRKMLLLPNGIDTAKMAGYKNAILARSAPKRTESILYVGRVTREKGLDLLIQAFSNLHKGNPTWKLEIVGDTSDGPYKSEVDELLDSLDLRGSVDYLGPLYGQELAERYLKAGIFCLPSRHESFGIALIEAAFFGNAIVSADVGASRYVLDYGRAGLIFTPGNVKDLTEKLQSAISNENLRNELGRVAKGRCSQLFDWGTLTDRLYLTIKALKR